MDLVTPCRATTPINAVGLANSKAKENKTLAITNWRKYEPIPGRALPSKSNKVLGWSKNCLKTDNSYPDATVTKICKSWKYKYLEDTYACAADFVFTPAYDTATASKTMGKAPNNASMM